MMMASFFNIPIEASAILNVANVDIHKGRHILHAESQESALV
jgi:hypothetical protein